jgi:tetratricopeptide (TPR) repeat protein
MRRMNRNAEQGLAGARKMIGKFALAVAVMAMLLATSGCNKLRARDQLNKGVQAYKNSHFEQAVSFFRKAIDLDPELSVAKLYLATACVAQYVPGADTPENNRYADCAIEQYQKVLESEKDNKNTVVLGTKGLASIYYSMTKFDEAKKWHQKAIELDPSDPENYYSVAVIDWNKSYVPRVKLKAELGVKPTDPIKDKKACAQLRESNLEAVEEGIQMLQKAIDLRKDYDDAMAYLNLMYRERADIQCDDPAARDADLKLADQMVDETMRVKKMKAEKAKEQTGIVLDTK